MNARWRLVKVVLKRHFSIVLSIFQIEVEIGMRDGMEQVFSGEGEPHIEGSFCVNYCYFENVIFFLFFRRSRRFTRTYSRTQTSTL
jgi:hypothetical protein